MLGCDLMKIGSKYTQNIVESLNEIINQDINFMNEEGIIIASTDENRIGKYHGGAKKAIEQKEQITIYADGEYEGALKGINLPVSYEGEIIGVVGITGEEKEVRKYGQIIQRMTEILIKEAAFETKEQSKRDAERFLVEEIVEGKLNKNSLETDTFLLNLPPGKYAAVIINVHEDVHDNVQVQGLEIYKTLYNTIRKRLAGEGLLAHNGSKFIAIIQYDDKNKIQQDIEHLINHVDSKYNISLTFAIGTAYDQFKEIKHSFEEAVRANRTLKYAKGKKLAFYEDLDLEILFAEISKETKNKYVEHIFKNISQEKLSSYSEIIDTYVRKKGSILEASKELFIHKNTLQYRLNKIHHETNYNPRNLRELIILYIAMMLANE